MVVLDIVDDFGLREGEVVLAVRVVGTKAECALVGEDCAGYLALLEVGVAEVIIDFGLCVLLQNSLVLLRCIGVVAFGVELVGCLPISSNRQWATENGQCTDDCQI